LLILETVSLVGFIKAAAGSCQLFFYEKNAGPGPQRSGFFRPRAGPGSCLAEEYFRCLFLPESYETP
jgi:hypothetical protein